MPSTSPLVFRPSPAQRTLALLLTLGSWFVGIQGLARLLQNVPRLLEALRVAQANGEPTLALWVALIAGFTAIAGGGVLLLAALLGWLLIEGTHVLVDEWGLTVDLHTLPRPLARRLGSGRLTWKQITQVRKGPFFFCIQGEAAPDAPQEPPPPALRFLVVDELERLLILILERSPHLRL